MIQHTPRQHEPPNSDHRSEEGVLHKGVLSNQAALESFVLNLQARGRATKTILSYTHTLSQLERFADAQGMPPLLAMSGEHIQLFFKAMFDRGNKANSILHHHGSLKSFFSWAEEEGELGSRNPMARIKRPRVPDTLLPHYGPEELNKVLSLLPAKSNDELVLRDRAMILALFDTGVRAAELCSLTRASLNVRDKTLRVIGKGGKQRLVAFGPLTGSAIDRWLRRRRSIDSEALFCSKNGDAVNNRSLRAVLTRRFAKAGVTFRGAHAFRRGFGISFLDAGGDPDHLRTLAGWNSYSMLRHYVRATESQRAMKAYPKYAPSDRLKA